MTPWQLLCSLAALTSLAQAAVSPQADPKADTLLRQAREATTKITTLRAEVLFADEDGSRQRGTLVFQRPDLARIEVRNQILVVSDGKRVITYLPQRNQFMRFEMAGQGGPFPVSLGQPIDGLIRPSTIDASLPGSSR